MYVLILMPLSCWPVFETNFVKKLFRLFIVELVNVYKLAQREILQNYRPVKSIWRFQFIGENRKTGRSGKEFFFIYAFRRK